MSPRSFDEGGFAKTPNPRPGPALSDVEGLLISYFRSGWAFLIPYLAAYLLYAWLKWPVNPASGEGLMKGVGESAGALNAQLSALNSQRSIVPCLLHVYWFLHGLHAILGAIALRTWWRAPTLSALNSQPSTAASRSLRDRLWSLIPWLCLALIFWIPGVYLEWPSDPWEHLRRINEWRLNALVTDHSEWFKSSYFIPYSLLSWTVGLRQLYWLDSYYTGICLLLCWQYYRLARSCCLNESFSTSFVILQTLLLGNNIFSFYRYYGISSSIYAQLAAVALTRIAVDAAKSSQLSLHTVLNLMPARGSKTPPKVYSLLLSSFLLLALITLNHQQGLGILFLGVGAVCVWRLVEWKRSALWWIIGTTLVANALFLWLYPREAITETFRVQNYLNAWFGFNILDFSSPAGDRMLQIVGAFGLVNFIAAFALLRRNNVIAWLTILPVGALLLPCIAVPLAQALASHGGDWSIVTFQRMLFAIPPCLALTCVVQQWNDEAKIIIYSPRRRPLPKTATTTDPIKISESCSRPQNNGFFLFMLGCTVSFLLMVTSGGAPTYNRTWHATVAIPNDLQLRDIYSQYETIKLKLRNAPETKIVTTNAGAALRASYAIEPIGPNQTQLRAIGGTPIAAISTALDFLGFNPKNTTLPPAEAVEAISPVSTATDCNLLAAPKKTNSVAWITLGGRTPDFETGDMRLPSSSVVIQNPIDATSHVFTAALIPIQLSKSYRLEMSVRQIRGHDATAFLAIAWYDAARNLLESNVAQPNGAGNPRGWGNGTYSYFGLESQRAPTAWTRFGISFGLHEAAAIPSRARYVRVGALLNYNVARSAVVQLTNVQIREKNAPDVRLSVPKATNVYTSTSQSAALTNHWPTQQVMTDRGGAKEIQDAASYLQIKDIE